MIDDPGFHRLMKTGDLITGFHLPELLPVTSMTSFKELKKELLRCYRSVI